MTELAIPQACLASTHKRISTFLDRNSHWVFLTPAVLMILLLTLYPFIYTAWVSLHDFDITNVQITQFTGLKNYLDNMKKPQFWNALKVTALFTLIVVPMEFVLGFIVALIMDVDSPVVERLRTFLIIPMMIAPVSVAILWRLMYQPEIGIINYLLSLVGIPPQLWLGDVRLALFSVSLVDIWQWTPFMFLIILAGLRSVPVELEEAARVDGAGALQTLFHVTIPLLRNVFLIAILLRFLDAVRTYDIIYIMTRGGPAIATDVYSMYLYRDGFLYFHIESAAALSIILLVLLSILVPFLFFRLLRLQIEV